MADDSNKNKRQKLAVGRSALREPQDADKNEQVDPRSLAFAELKNMHSAKEDDFRKIPMEYVREYYKCYLDSQDDYACGISRTKPQMFDELPQGLQEDEEFLSSFLNDRPWCLAFMPVKMQVLFPRLVTQCLRGIIERVERAAERGVAHTGVPPSPWQVPIEDRLNSFVSFQTGQSFASHVARVVREEVWPDRDLVRRWFQAGGDFTKKGFPQALQSDKEVFFWVAHHSRYAELSFQQAAPELLADKYFMAKCIDLKRSLIKTAQDDIKQDLQIILLAFGKTRSDYPTERRLSLENTNYREYLHQGLDRINLELQWNEAYYAENLDELAQHSTSPLALLNQVTIQIIASFAVPNEDQKTHLHNAQANFTFSIARDLIEDQVLY